MWKPENMLIQIFDRRKLIIQHVQQQADLYDQYLASKLLIEGIPIPPWLIDSLHVSDVPDSRVNLQGSEQPYISQPKVSTSQFVGESFTNTTNGFPDNVIEKKSSCDGVGAVNLDTYPQIPSSSCVFDPISNVDIASPSDHIGICQVNKSANFSSLIHRSRSRQKALDLRNSFKKASKYGSKEDIDKNNATDVAVLSKSPDDLTSSGHIIELLELAKSPGIKNDNNVETVDGTNSKYKNSIIPNSMNKISNSGRFRQSSSGSTQPSDRGDQYNELSSPRNFSFVVGEDSIGNAKRNAENEEHPGMYNSSVKIVECSDPYTEFVPSHQHGQAERGSGASGTINDLDEAYEMVNDNAPCFDLDVLDLPNNIMERANVLEQICRSASIHSPISQFPTLYKLNEMPDFGHSCSNEIMERSYEFNNDTEKQLTELYAMNSPSPDDECSMDNKKTCTSPVRKPWDEGNTLFNSEKTKMRRSFNPNSTCFPIEEEGNGNIDEVIDSFQDGGVISSVPNFSKGYFVTEITEQCTNPPADTSVEYLNVETSFNPLNDEVKQNTEDDKNRKRTQMNDGDHKNIKHTHMKDGKEDRYLSVGADSSRRKREPPCNRISKQKSSRNTGSLKNKSTSLLEDQQHNNIVHNITSFVPFVHQKQNSTIFTGKRDIKVKALETAEAAKRLEEKREIERKMKKEALKLERARLDQIKKLESKKKEEELRRNTAATNKRKRDAEVSRVRKKNHIEVAKAVKKGDTKLHLHKEDQTSVIMEVSDVADTHVVVESPEEEEGEPGYVLSPYRGSDDEDDDEETSNRKPIPDWASKTNLACLMDMQQAIDPKSVFPPESLCPIWEIVMRR